MNSWMRRRRPAPTPAPRLWANSARPCSISRTETTRSGSKPVRALEQYQRLRRHTDTFIELLGSKLNVGELTYVRYFNAVQTLEESILQILYRSADQLRILSHRVSPEGGDVLVNSRETDQRLTDVDLERNEAALVALNDLHLAVGQMRDLDNYSKTDLGTLVEDLERLAKHAEQFR